MILYDLLLFLFLIPKFLIGFLKGKKHPRLLERFGFFWPQFTKEVIWIHAVSVGEVKAASSFYDLLKEKKKKYQIILTTVTETGAKEAARSLKDVKHFYLPVDLSFIVKRVARKVKPKYFFLIENDIWPNLLTEVKKAGGKVFLLSGKMSERTERRLKRFPFLSKILYSNIDQFFVQSEEHANRFQNFVPFEKVQVTGDLKVDLKPQKRSQAPLSTDLPFLSICSTHEKEEDLLLGKLLSEKWNLFLAPRHPERISKVMRLLEKKQISFILFSTLLEGQVYRGEKVILVDRMGELSFCYHHSFASVIGGSFIPEIGGHNVLEPCLYGKASLFGPYTFKQKELVKAVINEGAGGEVSLDHLLKKVENILENKEHFFEKARLLERKMKGATQRTWEKLSLNL